MRFLSTRIHGVIDYVVGVLLVIVPNLFGFADNGSAQWIFVVLGIAAILYSLVTDYELGLVHLLPMPAHLALDAASGVLLAASPWLFGFHDRVYVPHLVFGLFEILASLITRSHPDRLSAR